MTRRAVVICPGRGTYNKAEIGYLARHHAGRVAPLDAAREAEGLDTLTALDGAERFAPKLHLRGDIAAPLIYACSALDAGALAEDIEVVAVTGNSMGWYTALAVGGALSLVDGLRVTTTMGRLMHDAMIGGQLIYPCTDADWRADPNRRAALLATVAEIDARADHVLRLSIDLGGMLVLAGNGAGLDAFESDVPRVQDRFPLRLPGHAAFHTDLQAPVAEAGRAALGADLFHAPAIPLIDGRGAIWWPEASDPAALRAYTLGHQVTEAYDFARAIAISAREFAPDLFIVTGPGTTLGGAVAQSLIACGWDGMQDKPAFQTWQEDGPRLVSMGREDQRGVVT
ncbi:ACP S-malonyltransferase [Roseovarius spongiae]|uniref:[acyl-carrier-protein] S-malonyltransferase n=1 Tax=Roseovarius spongiae TaxID=2320272 RepID=A0A3A8AYX1_9RHOB|nr:ACP S-malonyltransferase [Roseovarius spongiae]RKF16080.1 ACP S-malonyltransferase [Roseovarius spongiae]